MSSIAQFVTFVFLKTSSLRTIRVVRSRRNWLASHVACIGGKFMHIALRLENFNES